MHTLLSALIILSVAFSSRVEARPPPRQGDDFFALLATYQDHPLQLRAYVTENLRTLDPDQNPVEWVRNYSFYRITQASENGTDVLNLHEKAGFASQLALKHKLFPEYLSFKVMELDARNRELPKNWRTLFDEMIQEAEATGDHRVVAEISRVYSNFLARTSVEESAAMAQKALKASLSDVRVDDILPILLKVQIADRMTLLGNGAQAETLYLDILDYARRTETRNMLANTAWSLAALYQEKSTRDDWLKAAKLHQEAMRVATSINQQRTVLEAEYGLAEVDLKLGRLNEVLEHLVSLRKRETPANREGLLRACLQLEAKVLFEQKQYKKALNKVDEAFLHVSGEASEVRQDLLKIKLDSLIQLKEFSGLAAIVSEYTKIWQDILQKRQTKGIPQLQAQMGMGLEQQKSALLLKENELQQQTLKVIHAENRLKNWLIGTALTVTGMLAFGLFTLRMKNREINKLHAYIKNRVLQRFLPPQIVAEVMSGRSPLDNHPHTQLITVLFADLVGFTRATDSLAPDCVARILNGFMSRMTDLIFAQDGTIDKFIGDAIMVVFGAPSHMAADQQAERSIACAKTMQAMLSTLNQEWRLAEGCEFEMRIGIHQGQAIVGSFGSEKRSDYTVIGRTVNIASRIENRAAPGEILFSAALAEQLREPTVNKGLFTLRGIEEPMQLFALPSATQIQIQSAG